MTRQISQYHTQIGHIFVPGIKARIPHESGGYLLRSNPQGFRCDHAFEAAKNEAPYRALLFGDSYTAGDGVSNGCRYGDLLETQIPGLQVYNFGLPGTGTDQHYLAYRHFAGDIEHDVLIIGVLVENIRRVAARFRPFGRRDGVVQIFAKPYFELIDGRLELRNVPVPKGALDPKMTDAGERRHIDRGGRYPAIRKLVNQIGLRDWLQQFTSYQPVPDYDDPAHPNWLLMRAILEAWISESRAPTIVMPLPLYQHIEESSDPGSYRRRFRELSQATGCILHDPLDDLRAYPKSVRRTFRFEKDVHPTTQGHQAIADSLAPAVMRSLGLDH